VIRYPYKARMYPAMLPAERRCPRAAYADKLRHSVAAVALTFIDAEEIFRHEESTSTDALYQDRFACHRSGATPVVKEIIARIARVEAARI